MAFGIHVVRSAGNEDVASPVQHANLVQQGDEVRAPAENMDSAKVLDENPPVTNDVRPVPTEASAVNQKPKQSDVLVKDEQPDIANAVRESTYVVNEAGEIRVRSSAVIANNDLDKDGKVTKDEATRVGKALLSMWDRYDLNKDGVVDEAEVSKASGM
jgi:hypothetical protein